MYVIKDRKTSIQITAIFTSQRVCYCSTAYCLHKFKVCEYILEEQTVCVTDLASQFNANEGYLNIALRLIASQGWLDQNINNLNNKGFTVAMIKPHKPLTIFTFTIL